MFDLTIKNFRSFKDQDFSFSKINILIGENSSGKSSLLKFFLALKQTLSSQNNTETNFAFSGQYADLGNYKETIFYNQEDLPLSFAFSLYEYDPYFFSFVKNVNFGSIRRIKSSLGNAAEKSTNVSFSLTKELNNHESINCFIENEALGKITFLFTKTQDSNKNIFLETSKPCSLVFEDYRTKQKFTLNNLRFEKDGFLTLVQASTLEASILKLLDLPSPAKELLGENQLNYESVFYPISYLLIAQNYLQRNIEKMEYINPIKTAPNRIYFARDAKDSSHINDIEDFVHFFSKENEQTKILLGVFISILKNFGILDDLEILNDPKLPVRELRVKIKDHFSNITDVGYGVSLQLPIILKCFLAEILPERHGSIILIEQPEVHLHPKLHAKLIDTLLMLSKRTTYVIETHSEHILRKLQVAVKEKKAELTPESVSIHYLIREENSKVTAHKIQQDGKLIPSFPSGFFDNSYQLSRALLD
ncbi:DUF3696 domain-containing protein [Flavobacterium anhuiense]|uniref:DUF3696 domain-containing protein n=1 Tax=Flavobacterium anhuiense TaxID=459526 RepID=UPI000E6C698F|nr:DUF3696 domain-containing protein [Flavobacterium anhuiense]